jgi:hypothetical protein
MVHQCHNFALEEGSRLTAALSHTAATGIATNGTVSSIDFGQVAPAFNVNTSSTAPYARFAVVVDWSGIDTGITGTYQVIIQGADDAAFTTGTTRLGVLILGSAAQTGNEFATPANGREVFYVDNVSVGSAGPTQNTKRFIRLQVIATYSGGTANLQLVGAWIAPI